ncbi:MAG: hypothetical protein AAF438_01280 [Pseudomonadota bacterium]
MNAPVQPNDFGFDADARSLRDVATRFFSRQPPAPSGTYGLLEQAGYAALPGPLRNTFSVTSNLSDCGNERADVALGLIAEGNAFSFAGANEQGSLANDESEIATQGNTLNGQAWHGSTGA